jgi:hypothetical protein
MYRRIANNFHQENLLLQQSQEKLQLEVEQLQKNNESDKFASGGASGYPQNSTPARQRDGQRDGQRDNQQATSVSFLTTAAYPEDDDPSEPSDDDKPRGRQPSPPPPKPKRRTAHPLDTTLATNQSAMSFGASHGRYTQKFPDPPIYSGKKEDGITFEQWKEEL